jgi:hypothetical protein
MSKNKIRLLLIALLVMFELVSLSGCGKIRTPVESHSPLKSDNIKSFAHAEVKKSVTLHDLSCCVKSFHGDWKYDTQVLSAFGNTVVYAFGSGKVVHPPTGLVYEDHLLIYDFNKNHTIKIIDADPGFVQFWDTGINKNWIVWDEVNQEFDQTVKGYAMNRSTGDIKLIFSIDRNNSESAFWFGTKDPSKIKNISFNLNGIILQDNRVYLGYNLDKKKPAFTLSSRIVSIDLNNLEKSILVKIDNPKNAGLSHFSVNKHYIAFSIFGNDGHKMFSDIYIYSFAKKKTEKFTDNNLSDSPVLTSDDYIVFILRSQKSMEMPPTGYNDAEYLAIAPVNNPGNAKIITKSLIKTDQIAISPSGRFVLLDDYAEGWFVYDRKKQYLLLLKAGLLPVRPVFASDSVIAGLHQEDGGFSLLHLNLLYKKLKLGS